MRFFSKAETCRIDVSTRAEGSLTAPGDIEIFGVLAGKRIEARGSVVVHAKAEAAGALKCQTLLVEPGATFRGPAAVGPVPSDLLKRYGPVLGLSK